MSIAKYSSYKKTIERWVTHVPEHWHMLSGKRLFSNIRVRALKTDEQLAASQAYGVIPQSLMIKKNDAKVMLALKGTESFRHVDKNDFVISLRSFEGGIEHSEYTGCVSPAYTVLKPREFCSPEYFRHLLKSDGFISALQSTTDSLRDGKSISYEQFGSITLPCPPLKEQTKIAQFLDYETAKIDALIDEQKRLIELLKEKRQAVISHAVTKGLNPDTPMKDSGVEWLGEVPEHWVLCKLKHLSEISGRIGFRGYTTQDLVDDGEGAITLSPSNMVNGKMDFRKRTYISWHKYYESPEIQLTEGDIVLVKTGSTYGRTAFVDRLIEKTTINPQLAIIRATKTDKKYLFLLLSSEYFKAVTKNNNTGGTMPTMTQESVMSIIAPNPPLEEQKAIVEKVESSLKRLEVLETEALNGISFLQERRSALISAAVTGRIDVRDWQPPAGSDTVDSNASMQTERHYG